MNVLEIANVDVWFADGPHVLHDVSLEVAEGEHWALLGPNGAGKSTLLALASAQRFPSRGTVRILGKLMGADLKRAQYRDGARFCKTVLARADVDLLNQAFSQASMLPSLVEIHDPEQWLHRVGR